GSGDQNYWIASLHIVDVAAATMREIYKPKLQIAEPRWADVHHIVFIEGLMSEEGSNGGGVMSVDDGGANARNLTPGMKASASAIIDGPTFAAVVNGEHAIMRVGGETIWHGAETLLLA